MTNDAIQQTANDFGKYESGNKLSFSEFSKYLRTSRDILQKHKGYIDFEKQILPQIRHLVTQSFKAVAVGKIDPERKNQTFELFGFDFMIDEDFTVYLIEANTNPCLETNSSVLSRLIPVMLDNTFSLALEPLLPPPDLNFKRANEALHQNQYQLVFDESVEGDELRKNLENYEENLVESTSAFWEPDHLVSSLIKDNMIK